MAADVQSSRSDPGAAQGRLPLRGPTIFLLICAILALAGVVSLGLPLAAGIIETMASR